MFGILFSLLSLSLSLSLCLLKRFLPGCIRFGSGLVGVFLRRKVLIGSGGVTDRESSLDQMRWTQPDPETSKPGPVKDKIKFKKPQNTSTIGRLGIRPVIPPEPVIALPAMTPTDTLGPLLFGFIFYQLLLQRRETFNCKKQFYQFLILPVEAFFFFA